MKKNPYQPKQLSSDAPARDTCHGGHQSTPAPTPERTLRYSIRPGDVTEQIEAFLAGPDLQEHLFPSGRITARGLARASGIPWATLIYLAHQLHFTLQLERRDQGRGRRMSTLSLEEARAVLTAFLGPRNSRGRGPRRYSERRDPKGYLGYFYLVQLEPHFDPGRFKAGWTSTPSNRLVEFLCSTPFGEYLHYWPCDRRWETVARLYITNGSEHLREEVYRARDLNGVIIRAANFFLEMPDPRLESAPVIPSMRGKR